jgi:uncharacterized protein YfiM (DUF2279 family)
MAIKILLATLAALYCGVAAAADSWTGADKGKHVAAGLLVAGSALQITDSPRSALAIGVAAAVGKEVLDAHRPGHVASYRDAVQAPGLVITPISVSWRVQW